MKIGLHIDRQLPVNRYGGTERVVWSLAKALHRAGHDVTLLAGKGTTADFARVVELNPREPLRLQLPEDLDIIHFQNAVPFYAETSAGDSKTPEIVGRERNIPYVVTIHGNIPDNRLPDPNAIFVSANHAARHGGTAYVHNGLDWDSYPVFRHGQTRKDLFFLGKAAWKVKNLRGAIKIARMAGERLHVLGGHRLNLKMGFRFTTDPHVRFHGMADNNLKGYVANRSRGLVFPVIWDEPFGLAIVESMYFGAPVFGSARGSLPELVIPSTGVLSDNPEELAYAIRDLAWDELLIHGYAAETFNADMMARKYLTYYEQRLNSGRLNGQCQSGLQLSPA